VLFLVGLIVVGSFLVHRLVLGYRSPGQRLEVIGAGDAAFLNAAAETLFPAGGAMPLGGEEANLPIYADRYLAQLPPAQRRLIRALFLLFEQSTLFFPARGVGAFRRFSSMTPEQRETVFRGWEGSSLYLRRTAFVALKAVLIMGYFGHPDSLRHLGLERFEFETPICEADLLYPAIGKLPASIRYRRDDLTPPSDGTPLTRPEASG
jgi:hypothetical protein